MNLHLDHEPLKFIHTSHCTKLDAHYLVNFRLLGINNCINQVIKYTNHAKGAYCPTLVISRRINPVAKLINFLIRHPHDIANAVPCEADYLILAARQRKGRGFAIGGAGTHRDSRM